MTECNAKVLEQARANVAARYVQPYHKRAILGQQWDGGREVQDELERLLKCPPDGAVEE